MAERSILLQYIINQRTERPVGLRIWSDGELQRPAETNLPPDPTARLDNDRDLDWQTVSQLSVEQVEEIKQAVQQIGFFDLPPRLLINYCKEDPGTMIWTVNLDGQTHRVVVFDPRPKRSAQLDQLSATLKNILPA
jgi:hypothetical protein